MQGVAGDARCMISYAGYRYVRGVLPPYIYILLCEASASPEDDDVAVTSFKSLIPRRDREWPTVPNSVLS